MEQFTNTEELLRRIRENVPEILGGESNPDMEDEVEQIMCVVESAPRVAPEGVRPVAHIAWRKRPKQFVVYDPVPTNECLYTAGFATRRIHSAVLFQLRSPFGRLRREFLSSVRFDYRRKTQNMKKECSTCAWHDGYTWVCFNGNSEYRADFTDPENTCPAWEERKEQNEKT